MKHHNNQKFGIHYYPDTLHYREKDLQVWLPELVSLGVSDIILLSSIERAIPEAFINGLNEAGITPIIHFPMELPNTADPASLKILLESYGRWGIKRAIFFDRPNMRSAWGESTWINQDIPERFVDEFLPVAKMAIDQGISPVLPALEPGGNYWDTTFLRSVLESLNKRNEQPVLDHLMLSAYGWHADHSLNWGAGGQEVWRGVKPYLTPSGQEDQRGFRIVDWYETICQVVLGKTLPLILLGVGLAGDPAKINVEQNDVFSKYSQQTINIFELVNNQTIVVDGTPVVPLHEDIITVCFYALTSDLANVGVDCVWYGKQAEPSIIATSVKSIASTSKVVDANTAENHLADQGEKGIVVDTAETSTNECNHFIQHYLLLPRYSWGVSDWHLDVIRPFVKKHCVTVGFSITEAMYAQQVTVIGNEQSVSEATVTQLRQAGCEVERIDGDGTTIASILSAR